MYIFFIMLISASPLLCSEQQFREKFIKDAQTKTVGEIHAKMQNIPLTLSTLDGVIFFASLLPELRIRTLSNNFFYGNTEAAQQFESKPYAHALYLLAEYQQKPHPTQHLAPKWIFLLHPKQVAVVNEIEQQHLKNMQTPPAAVAAPVAAQPLFFLNPKSGYAKLSHQQTEILKTIPSQAFQSALSGKVICHADGINTIPNIIHDAIKSIIVDPINHETIALTGLCISLIDGFEDIIRHAYASPFPLMFTKNIYACSPAFDMGILMLLHCGIIPRPFNYIMGPVNFGLFKSWGIMRATVEIGVLGATAMQPNYATTSSKMIMLMQRNWLCIAPLVMTIGLCVMRAIESRNNYQNQYIIGNKKNNWCTLL